MHWAETGILKSLVYVEEQLERWQQFFGKAIRNHKRSQNLHELGKEKYHASLCEQE